VHVRIHELNNTLHQRIAVHRGELARRQRLAEARHATERARGRLRVALAALERRFQRRQVLERARLQRFTDLSLQLVRGIAVKLCEDARVDAERVVALVGARLRRLVVRRVRRAPQACTRRCVSNNPSSESCVSPTFALLTQRHDTQRGREVEREIFNVSTIRLADAYTSGLRPNDAATHLATGSARFRRRRGSGWATCSSSGTSPPCPAATARTAARS
jgi:hypothetical protein